MDMRLNNEMHSNVLKYKRSIDRIIDKYSRLQCQDGGREVDFNNTNIRLIQKYMKRSETVLSSLESQSLTDLRDDSLRAHDSTRESQQLDITHQDVGTHDTGVSSVSSTQCTVEDYGEARSDVTQLTVSSFDESQKSFSSTEFQPEDHDEELEMSLRSHGKSFVELYPSMINRIGRAWHRRHVTEAADSVVRRYRRWRQQPNRTYLNDTFIVTARHSNPRQITSKTPIKEMISSPVKIQVMGTDAVHRSPLRMLVSPQSKQQSPSRVRGEHNPPVLVIDLSDCSETSQPKPISLNETFNMSQMEQSSYIVSPPRPSYPTAKTSLGLAVKHKRFSLGAHSPQTDRSAMYPIHTTAAAESANISCSPLRPSPLKARMASSLSRSPHSFYRSPKAQPEELFSTEATRPRSMSTSLSSPPPKPSVPRSMLYEKDSHHSFQSQPSSPLSAKAGHRRLRRHLSFDSSLPFTRNSDSPKELDEDFIKLYHKFVCQNKSPFFRGLPCRYCLRSSEATRGHSSSALAALALSPHRSLLRKRHRELSLSSHPQSKRSRDDYPESSPEFKRHGMEMRRHSLSQSECEHYCFSRSPSKRSMFQGFITQQGSAQDS
ncbi:uncharacterized protein si:dkeyp-117h8.4 [Antennarius striatus]|uniref:uncharacterized protein si:dkeyp-117h8.4 n=1 Tax=Antennarius striatus TaxID=241820 RepID=UPI0035B30688